MGSRIQLQQRNCFRFSRNSCLRSTDVKLAKNCADISRARRARQGQIRARAKKTPHEFSALRRRAKRFTFLRMPAAFLLLFVVVIFRVVSGFAGSADFAWMHNVAPLAAVALCGAAFLPRRIAFPLPLLMLFLSDAALNLFHYHQPLLTVEILPRYLALALIAALGYTLRGHARVGTLLAASIAGSLIFYVISNTGSWLYEPGYAKTFAGWLQALTIGQPGFPPTWWFLRNTLLGDLFFTLVFTACLTMQTRRDGHPAPSAADALAPW